MTPEEVILSCARRGVFLWRDGDTLRYRAKKGVLTPSALASLNCMKEALLSFLHTSPPPIIKGRELTPELWREWQEWVDRETARLSLRIPNVG